MFVTATTPARVPEGKRPIAFVLQGGGALGAHEWGAVSKLCEIGYHPVAVTGVSIGAINAAAIAGARKSIVESLSDLWSKLRLPVSPFIPEILAEYMSILGHPAMYNLRSDFYNLLSWTAVCEMTPLFRTLEEICDFKQLNAGRMGFAVTATDVETGDSKRFYNIPIETNLDTIRNQSPVEIKPDHILASGALPPGFPIALIDGDSYWDGGVFDNTPMAPMLDLLEALKYEDVPIVVIELFPSDERQPVPLNMWQLKNRMMELTYQNRFWDDYGGLESLRDYATMISTLAEGLPKDHPARSDPVLEKQFRNLVKRRHFRNLFVIPSSHVPLTGAMDFSPGSIEKRYRNGYRAAGKMLPDLERFEKELQRTKTGSVATMVAEHE